MADTNVFKLDLSHRVLSREEEFELGKKYAEGDMSAMEELVACNQKLILREARHYLHRGVEFDDLMQEGNIGLTLAIRHFDWSSGNRLATYAIPWIRKYLIKACYKISSYSQISLSEEAQSLIPRISAFSNTYFTENGEMPTAEEICTALNMDNETYEAILYSSNPVSLDSDISNGKSEGGQSCNLYGKVAADESVNSSDNAETDAMKDALNYAVNSLDPISRIIIRFRFGLVDGREYTLEECSSILVRLGITQRPLSKERIRQYQKDAIYKLRCNAKLASFE